MLCSKPFNASTFLGKGSIYGTTRSQIASYPSNEGAIGPDYAARATGQYLNNRKLSIYGGSNEVQRSIIAKTLLEL